MSPLGTAWGTHCDLSPGMLTCHWGVPQDHGCYTGILGESLDQCSRQKLTLVVLSCHPGACHSRARGSFLFWIECAVVRLAAPVRHLKPPTVGSVLIAAQGTPALGKWPCFQPPALSNACPQGAQVGPAICRAGNYTPAPQPLEIFLWTHRKHHLLLQKNHRLWSDLLRAREHFK